MTQDVIIKNIYCHYVGNRTTEEGIALSSKELNPDDKTMEKLLAFFLTPLKMDYLNVFYHEADLNLNEVYAYASKIFENPKALYEQSINLAKHLYEHSNHPKIKGGEFYVVYFDECTINGKTVDAVGLFKSENKDTFLKVYPSEDGFSIESQQGININKLDKGCLIFNTEKETGYVVAVVDNTNKGTEAHYWIDDFLHIRQRKDEYYNTQNIISMTKNFVTKALPQEFEISKADQADLTNRTLNFFKEKATFDIDEFTNEVIGQPEVIDSFNKYKNEYQKEQDIEIADSFTISDTAVKKQARILKSIIKLDKNFHIYIHGNNQYIKKGYDETTEMYFYQLFFREEL